MAKKEYDYLFKLVLIGDTGVGKSCILLRFTDDSLKGNFASTIGVDFRFRTVKVDKKTIKLQIWDTAGQERFRTLTSAYYRGADGIIMVYDVTNEESFKHINDWFIEVSRYASENTCKLIVGNKVDLPKVISTETATAYAEKMNMPLIETSALESINVDAAFETITKQLIESRTGKPVKSAGAADKSNVKTLSAAPADGNNKKKSPCC